MHEVLYRVSHTSIATFKPRSCYNNACVMGKHQFREAMLSGDSFCQIVLKGPDRVVQSVAHRTRKSGTGFDTRSCNIPSFRLPLFQEGQLSVTGECMCMKYWLTA